jgi:sodium-dependent dicarboxylate transporter 2/3/5
MIEETHISTESRVLPKIGLLLGPLLAVLVGLLPMGGISPEAHRLAGILALVVVFWVTEAVPLPATALLGALLAILFNVAPQKAILAPFASPITFLFIGSFMLAKAMSVHCLDERLAAKMLQVPFFGRSVGHFFLGLGLLTTGLSMWMSNAGTTAMMLPIGLAALASWPGQQDAAGNRMRFVLLIAFCASVGGLGTPVGTPPNLIGLGTIKTQLGVEFPFAKWMLLALPMVLLQMIFVLVLLRTKDKATPLLGQSQNAHARRAWTRGEVATLVIFLAAVLLWVVPGVCQLALGKENGAVRFFSKYVPEEAIGLLAGVATLVVPISWKTKPAHVLTWRQAVQIDWGTILIFAGGMALGQQLFDTGLAKAMSGQAIAWFGKPGLWTTVLVCICLSVLLSEAASNTASATVMAPTSIAFAQASGVDPLPVALGVTMACSMGFLLPASTGPNAQAYGTGHVSVSQMMRRGFLLDIWGILVIFSVLRVLFPILTH